MGSYKKISNFDVRQYIIADLLEQAEVISERTMTKTKLCAIQILTKSYNIKCPEEEMDNLKLAAQKLNDQLLSKKRGSKKLDDYQALLMAALHVSHELVLCENQQAEQRQQLARFIDTLESTVGVE